MTQDADPLLPSNEDPAPKPDLKAEARTRRSDPEDRPPNQAGRFAGPIFKSVGIALFLLVAVLTLSWTYRVDIANTVLPPAVSGFLETDVTLTVVALDLQAVAIENVTIQDGPRIETVDIQFDLAPGAAVPVETLTVRGLTATVFRDSSGAPRIRGLDAFFDAPLERADADRAFPTLPFQSLSIRDMTIDADTLIGRQRLTGDVSLRFPSAPAAFPLAALIDLNAPDTNSAVSLDAAVDGDRAGVSAILDLSAAHWLPFIPGIRTASGRLTAELNANGAGVPQSGDPVAWALAALSGAASLDWTGLSMTPTDLPPFAVSDGNARLDLGGGQASLEIAAPLEFSPSAMPKALLAALPEDFRAAFSGAPTIVVTPNEDRPDLLFRPNAGATWRVETGLELSWTQGPAQAVLTPRLITLGSDFLPLNAEFEGLRIDLVRGLNLPRDVTIATQLGPMDLDLSTVLAGEIPEVSVPFALNAAVFGDIAPPIWAERADIALSGTIEVSDNGGAVTATLAPGGGLSARGLTGTGDARLSPRISLDVAGPAPTRVDIIPSLGLQGVFRLSPVTVALPDQDPPVSVEVESQTIRLRHGPTETRITAGPFDIRELGSEFGAADIELDADMNADTASLRLTASGLSLGGASVLTGAVAADMAIARRDGAFTSAAGPISLADGRISLDTLIALGRDGGVGAVRVQSAPIQFGPTGLAATDIMPEALMAELPVTPELGGAMSFGLNLTPPGDTGANILALTLDGFSIAAEGFEVADVNGTLSFDPLAMPSSFGEQTLNGTIAAPILGRAPFKARFSVAPSARVSITEGGIEALGGSLSLIDGVVDPETSGFSGTFRLRRVDLSLLTDALALDGVSATGRLSGLLPTSLTPDQMIITNGSIAADGGGVLAITNPAVSQALASDNEAVQLFAEAMENFEYDTLEASVDLRPDGQGIVGLSLDGANPEVLDGYPFELNVNLETDLGEFFQIQKDLFTILRSIVAPLRLLNPRELPISSDDNSG